MKTYFDFDYLINCKLSGFMYTNEIQCMKNKRYNTKG